MRSISKGYCFADRLEKQPDIFKGKSGVEFGEKCLAEFFGGGFGLQKNLQYMENNKQIKRLLCGRNRGASKGRVPASELWSYMKNGHL